MVDDFEKLGMFYLGRPYNIQTKALADGVLLYDSRDLLTHAVCVGMTGSGKTGLCLSLLEEAAIDYIPVIAIDPKGDLTNLLLTFPNLSPEEFLPWVNEDEARRLSITREEQAARQSKLWADGLAQWGQSAERIRLLRNRADFAIYTPGSSAGKPISILKSFAAPSKQLLEDADYLKDKVSAAATSVLALLDIQADPLKSREHILLSNIFNNLWKKGEDVTLPRLIEQIQNPPMKQVGALDIESFFAARERFELAMSLNNLLAAPGFEAWLEGDALELDNILYTQTGKPKVSIFTIAHLSDSERMFFVTLLLNQIIAWMRTQSGTTSLRAIVFMDEIFGYFPPVANPPSKVPLLTLLKQARAYGVGVLLASQNPVDLDYKGLANAGTWFVGRLQTERDKQRLLDGLEGVAATAGTGFDRKRMDEAMSALGSRTFLLNNVHDDTPKIFQTRWTLSYLRGPLTREQIKQLSRKQESSSSVEPSTPGSSTGITEDKTAIKSAMPTVEPAQQADSTTKAKPTSQTTFPAAAVRPVLPPGITQYFLPTPSPPPAGTVLVYKPLLIGSAIVRFADEKMQMDSSQELTYLIPLNLENGSIPWSSNTRVRLGAGALDTNPAARAVFDPLPSEAALPESYKAWSKDFASWLQANQKLWLLKSTATGELSQPQETERDFRIRLAQLAREERDLQTEKLRSKYGSRITSLQDKVRRAEQEAALHAQTAQHERMQSAIDVGTTLLGAFMGSRRITSRTMDRASSAARSMNRATRKEQEAAHAQENLSALEQQLEKLELDFKDEMSRLERRYDAQSEPLEKIAIFPKKTNIKVKLLALAWVPVWRNESSADTAIWC